jgi:long-chain acyl-CoA synthetase
MLSELIASQVRRVPELTAIQIKRDGDYRRWSYTELWSAARSVAVCLREKGVGPGEHVGLFAENSPEWVLAYLGVVLAGAVVVPLDAQYTDRELRTLLKFAGCKVLLCDSEKKGLAEAMPFIETVITIDGESELFKTTPMETPVERNPDEPMALIFTSGTTGEPKGVLLSERNITSNLQAALTLDIINDRDTVLSILPLHHCYALTGSILIPLACGCSITMCTSLRGPDIISAIQETGVTVVLGVPKLFEGFYRAIVEKIEKLPRRTQRIFNRLLRLSGWLRRRLNWYAGKYFFRGVHQTFGPGFRFFVSGGAKLDPEITKRFLDLGIRVVEGYGLTETSPVVSFNPPDRPRPGSVGFAVPGVEIQIYHPDGEGVGEVKVRGPNVMLGYDRRPEETAEVIRDGWFYTGDLGYFDKDGYLFLTGRAKEVIVLASGKNIYPEDVERHYEQSPMVKEVCVMPVELADGQVSKLRGVVVPDFDELRRLRATGLTDVIRHEMIRMSQHVPTYMRVLDWKVVTNELPRTRLGKLKRSEIKRMAFDEVSEDKTLAISPEDQTLLDQPGASALLERIKTLSRYEGEILPGDHLEFDLGLDSLARIELDVILEQQFGITFKPEEIADVKTVRDLLKRLSDRHRDIGAKTGWDVILREKVSPPLSELFNLNRGTVRRGTILTVQTIGRMLSKPLFPFEYHGLENLPGRGPFLLCPNHCSRVDAVLVFMTIPRALIEDFFFMGAAELFESAFMRFIARAGRVIPTATTDTLLGSLRRAAEALSMGKAVCIFPEGYTTRDGNLQPARPGTAILACQLQVPIVPVLVRGTYDLLSYAHSGFRFRPVGLTFGTPIAPPAKDRFENADYLELMARWKEQIVQMRQEDDASGSPTAGKSPRIEKEG